MTSFAFREIPVYKKAKKFRTEINKQIKSTPINYELKSQLNRATISVILNIAEGYGRFHKADKRNFYINARASVYESVACLVLIF